MRSISTCILVLAALTSVTTAGEKKNLNPKLLSMPDNSWLKLSPKREPKSRAYSGNCFGGGYFWYFGGAHRSYMGNEVEIYDPVRNVWTASEKEWPAKEDLHLIASVKAPRTPLTAKGRPWPSHTYQQVCWVPERKAFFMVSRGHTWEFDPAKMKWTCLAGVASKNKKPSPRYQGAQSIHVVYDPDLKAPVGITTTGPFGIHVYDYKKMEWKRRKNAPMKWAELYSTYIGSRKLHLISGNKKHGMWTYNAVTEEWKKLEGVPEKLVGTQALAYDSANDIVLAVAKARKKGPPVMWKLDPKTLKWSEHKPASVGPATTGSWAPLWYDPDHNAFLYLNYVSRGPAFTGGKTETWAYRYKKAKEKK